MVPAPIPIPGSVQPLVGPFPHDVVIAIVDSVFVTFMEGVNFG